MEDEIYSYHRNNFQSTALRTDLSIAIYFKERRSFLSMFCRFTGQIGPQQTAH